MIAWRLSHARWADTALSGEGASRYPGRWNRSGERMVYLASSLALAVLETRVHIEVTITQQPYMALEFEIPKALTETVPALPDDWREDLEATRSIGSGWLKNQTALALRIPSAIIPPESNYLFNPLHPEIAQVRLVQRLEFIQDERLF